MMPSPVPLREGHLFHRYDDWYVPDFPSRRFAPEYYHAIVDKLLPPQCAVTKVGSSFEGRPIRLYSIGSGRTSVLLWSQMHGDESTATMAIADVLNYFRLNDQEDVPKEILASLRLLFVPMLNPDGAVQFQRRTAQGIDMNRDALALTTPEARLLRQIQQQHKPSFAFNLHDQELSTVGTSKELSALALLAPAFDERKSDNDVRRKAKHLAAFFAGIMNQVVPGKLARYDDAFEPRAFGDNLQKWGTSTLLVESGHTTNDPEKNLIRRLNAVGLITSFHALATGDYAKSDISLYESLPFNGKHAYDLIIRNIRVRHADGSLTPADLGISYQVEAHTGDTPTLADVGDLYPFVGLKEIDGKSRVIPHDSLVLGKPLAWERLFSS